MKAFKNSNVFDSNHGRVEAQAVVVFMARALKAIKVVIISNLAKEVSSSNPGFRVTQSS